MNKSDNERQEPRFSAIFFKFFILPFIIGMTINVLIMFNAPEKFVDAFLNYNLEYVVLLLCYSYTIYKPINKYFLRKRATIDDPK